ncbi:transcriptional regulator [Candidatus Scalindua japonica]|uniref:Transcriptional regulator n=1 Tax=Candidatus Scalindua japonica TaxID=1284222 RepID=A0A286U3Q9_9BACT|nr:MarR family transcriptional regulator [Candidatus Scalindua japonica]GAX62754.1 transcriptional regulator [Candidatus Scalindua japonica]
MLEYDFKENIGYSVAMAYRALRKALNAELAHYGTTFSQWQVLSCLAMEGEISQVKLAELIGVEGPTMVRILDRMEKKGWIRRKVSPRDRRQKLISPTKKVEDVWKKMTECAHGVRGEAVKAISTKDVANLQKILKKIRENLNG